MSPSRVAAVLFDLDGTLVDTEPLYFEATRQLFARFDAPEYTWEQHTSFIGTSTLETMRALRGTYGWDTSARELVTRLDALYLDLLRSATRVFPQMRRFVELLHEAGVPMAVASGSSREAIGAALRHGGLDTFFAVTVSAEEVPAGKPEPDVFLEAARRLGVAPGACVVVEDAAPGVAAARAAGMRCIVVPSVPVTPGVTPDPVLASPPPDFPGGQAEFTAEAAYALL